MVKTVQGSLGLEEIRDLLTEYARKLPSYSRVQSDTFDIRFRDESLQFTLIEATVKPCFLCKGAGIYEEEKCWSCDGSGERRDTSDSVSARLIEYDKPPRKGTLKIEVATQGTKPDIWKPDVEKIKAFIETLAGKPCVTVPTRKGKLNAVGIREILETIEPQKPEAEANPNPEKTFAVQPEPPQTNPEDLNITEEALETARQMEQKLLGQVHDEVRNGIQVRGEAERSEKIASEPISQVIDCPKLKTLINRSSDEGKAIESGLREPEKIDGISAQVMKPQLPPDLSEEVEEGVPEGFYMNRGLVDMNKGSYRDENDKLIINAPTIDCWGCTEQMTVCGFPYYICDNNHALNMKTGQRWNWVPTDTVYHPLLSLMHRVEKAYQGVFYPSSKKREQMESNGIFSDLSNVGRTLYDRLEIQEEDPYHWGRDNHKHHAGMRFAINLMWTATKTGKRVDFISRLDPRREEMMDLDGDQPLQPIRQHNVDLFLKSYGEAHLRNLLLSTDRVEADYKPKTTQNLDFFFGN